LSPLSLFALILDVVFIAPELATDREAKGAREITLSYTFYPSDDPAAQG
jgi:cytochrome c oxidase assembly protein subunit 11